jgi:hypothetical protein
MSCGLVASMMAVRVWYVISLSGVDLLMGKRAVLYTSELWIKASRFLSNSGIRPRTFEEGFRVSEWVGDVGCGIELTVNRLRE